MKFVRMILVLLLVTPGLCSASRAIFYQPQLRDVQVPVANWPIIFQAVRQQGIDTLIVQWTSYGDVLDKNDTRQWLKNRLEEASASGLKLVVGLSADPELFTRLEQPAKVLADYFRKQRQQDTDAARYWLGVLPENRIAGWYMTMEIDDRRWRESNAFDVLNAHIQSETRALQAIGQKPVFISTFFAGNMSPQQYADMLMRLKKDSPVHILVQDGRGTGKLSVRERELYLDTLSDCKAPVADGIVYEIFKQTQHDKEFQAVALPAQELEKVLNMRAPCNKETVLFSLRYLIDLQQPLKQ